MIEGDPFIAAKIRNKKKEMNLTDYYLSMDRKEDFSSRRFS